MISKKDCNFIWKTMRQHEGFISPLVKSYIRYLVDYSGYGYMVNKKAFSLWQQRCNRLFLYKFAVCKNCIGKGEGKKMMMQLVEKAKEIKAEKINLFVKKDNERAIRFYEKEGFKMKGKSNRNIEMEMLIGGQDANAM